MQICILDSRTRQVPFRYRDQFVENIDDMDYDTEPPVKVGPDGYYPVPIPGKWSEV